METSIYILLTTYNSEKYIGELLESIFNQTFKDFKIFVSDDFSKDRTIEILNRYKEEYPKKIDIYRNKSNLGLNKNFNNLMKNINYNSKYIVCADHDDIWKSEKLEVQYDFMEKNKDMICSFHDRTLFNKDKVLINSEYKENGFNRKHVDFKIMLNEKVKYSFNTMIFRNKKEILNKVLPVPKKFSKHDYWMGLFLAYYGGKIGYIHKSLIKYRIHNNNLSQKFEWKPLTYSRVKKIYSENEIKKRENKKIVDDLLLKNKLLSIGYPIDEFNLNQCNFMNKAKNKILMKTPFFIILILKKIQRLLE